MSGRYEFFSAAGSGGRQPGYGHPLGPKVIGQGELLGVDGGIPSYAPTGQGERRGTLEDVMKREKAAEEMNKMYGR